MENFLKDKIILKNCLVLILFVFITAIIYYPTFHSAPLWDDWNFIFKSWTLRTHATPLDYWLWGEYRRSWPMFYSTISIMYKIWKMETFNYHLVSALLHAVNCFLVYRVLKKLNGGYPLLISILLLVHPLQFFNVIWIIQLKTLMCIFFFLVSLLLFIEYEKNLSKFNYIFSVIFFGLSIFSKAAFAPIVILLIFYKNKKRMIPFIGLCLYSIILTTWFTHIKPNSDKISKLPDLFVSKVMAQSDAPKNQRQDVAVVMKKLTDPLKDVQLTLNNLKRYTVFLVFPSETLLIQVPTAVNGTLDEIFFAGLIVSGIACILLYYWNKKDRLSFIGFSFYLITLIPLAGIFFIPIFNFSNFIDYWLAVPVLGLIICLSFTEFKFKKNILITFILLFAVKSNIQVRKTPEPISIINSSIEQSPGRSNIKFILVKHYFNVGDYAKSNMVINNVRNTSNMNEEFWQKQIDENDKGLRGEEVNDGAL